jgi:hypothetical protein
MARRRVSMADEWQTWAKRYDIDGGVRTFESGLTVKVVLGALFIGLLMMPGTLYLSLVSGQSGAAAAPWVAVILFTELARRSFTTVKRQELYILLGLAGAAVGAGQFYGGFIRNQYFIQSPQALQFEVADKVPFWAIPAPDSEAIATRSLIHKDWLWPIVLLLMNQTLGRIRRIGGTYFFFRMTADLERLPFPLAPVSAQGATALAETTGKTETWRWRVFSLASMLGLIWGAIYIGVPALTGVMMTRPIQIIKIPWIDFTTNIEGFAPTGRFALRTQLNAMLQGFVLPFPMVLSRFAAEIFTQFILNPQILYRMEILHSWHLGDDVRATEFANRIDFWLSFGMGKSFCMAALGIMITIPMLLKYRGAKAKRVGERGSLATPPGRGDFPLWLAGGMWLVGMSIHTYVIHRYLIPLFPLGFLLFFAFFWTPLNSYISARTFGIVNRDLFEIPYLRQATFIMSRYEEIDVWFAPWPIEDYGRGTMHWRVLELTGTTFTSSIAATVITLPVLLVSGILVWHFIWKLAPIPSAVYPHAQVTWPMWVTERCMWVTSLRDGQSQMLQAIRGRYVLLGFTSLMGLYGIMWLANPLLPGGHSMYYYGFLHGLGADPGMDVWTVAGAFLGKYYMVKKFGLKRWYRYTPVLLAGFGCGVGLVSMAIVAIALVSKAVIVKPF